MFLVGQYMYSKKSIKFQQINQKKNNNPSTSELYPAKIQLKDENLFGP